MGILGGKAKPLKKPKSDKKDYDEVFPSNPFWDFFWGCFLNFLYYILIGVVINKKFSRLMFFGLKIASKFKEEG